MVLKQQVVDAFRVLDIDPATTNVQQATTAYKKLALKHHPDRNYGDPAANERFQEVCIPHFTLLHSAEFFWLDYCRLVRHGRYASAILNILHRLRYLNLEPRASISPLAGHTLPRMKCLWMVLKQKSSSGM